jgi:hypothetical protein
MAILSPCFLFDCPPAKPDILNGECQICLVIDSETNMEAEVFLIFRLAEKVGISILVQMGLS